MRGNDYALLICTTCKKNTPAPDEPDTMHTVVHYNFSGFHILNDTNAPAVNAMV